MYQIEANGTPMGTYHGHDEADALDSYARHAGYQSLDHLLNEVPEASAEEIHTDNLLADV